MCVSLFCSAGVIVAVAGAATISNFTATAIASFSTNGPANQPKAAAPTVKPAIVAPLFHPDNP